MPLFDKNMLAAINSFIQIGLGLTIIYRCSFIKSMNRRLE
ncbi:MAG: hypothetical protein ACJAVJ_000847 [Planctomycetota bacterium]|jgi:hypothetical protein